MERFASKGAEDVYNGADTKSARKVLPRNLHSVAGKKIDRLVAAGALHDLRVPPGNHLEALSENRKGQHSIRINDQYRICFTWTDQGPMGIEIVDYH